MSVQFELNDRNCYHCNHYGLCFLRRSVDEVLSLGSFMLNLNNPSSAPRNYQAVYESLALACVQFERSTEGIHDQPIEGELARQLNIGLAAARKAVENYNLAMKVWDPEVFAAGAKARVERGDKYEAPSMQEVGAYKRASWLAGWDDADAAINESRG